MKKLWSLLSLILVLGSVDSALLPEVKADLPTIINLGEVLASVDGSRGSKYKDGTKPPTSGVLSCNLEDWIANFPNLLDEITGGAALHHDITTYFSGTGKPTATFTVIAVTGDNSLTISGNQYLDYDAVDPTEGSFKVRGTASGGGDVDCPITGFRWEDVVGGTDSQAAVIPTGFQYTAAEGSVTVSVDAPSDAVGLASSPLPHTGVDKIQFRFNGGTPVDVDAQLGLSTPLTVTNVGGASSSVSASGTGYTITDNGSTGWDTAGSDQFVFVHAPLTGDGAASITISSVSGGGGFGKAVLMGRVSNSDLGSQYFSFGFMKNNSETSGKAQGKNRANTGGTASIVTNDVITLPASFRIERSGSACKMRVSTASGLTWTDAVNSFACADPTYQWGIAVTSQAAGTPMTVTTTQWSLNNQPRLSYQHTTASAVTVESRSFDVQGNISNWTAGSTATPLAAPPPSGGIKWHPGQWLLADNGADLAKKITYCTEARNNTGLKGIQVRFFWRELEGAQGDYTAGINLIRQLLAACSDGASPAKKRLMVEIWWRSFGGSGAGCSSNSIVPNYVANIGGQNNLVATGDGCIVAIWRQAVADRAMALYQALGAEFDDHAYFEMISTKETAVGSQTDDNAADYSAVALLTQYKRILGAAREAFPTTNVRVFANFFSIGTNQNMIDLIEFAKANKICVGGPDHCSAYTQGNGTCLKTQAMNVMDGTIGGHDYRGEICVTYNYEQHDLSRNTMATLNGWGNTDRKSNYRPWMRYTWGTTNNWTSVMLPYLNSNPNTITTCPSTFTCNTN